MYCILVLCLWGYMSERWHREAVFEKVAKATSIEPVELTPQAIEDTAGEPIQSLRSLEILFTVYGRMPGLRYCEKLQVRAR